MPWDLEILFSGLCLFVPKKIQSGEGNGSFQGVLLAGSGQDAPCTPLRHEPLLTFHPGDLGDASGNVKHALQPDFRLVPDARANHLASVTLGAYDISLDLHNNQVGGLRTVDRQVGSDQGKPAHSNQADDFKWILDLKELGVDGLHQDCFNHPLTNHRVAARMALEHGELSANRLGWSKGKNDYSLWDFHPPPADRKALIRTLADKAKLSLRDLTDSVTLVLKGESGVEKYYTFPDDLDRRSPVQLSISNLPAMPQVHDSDVLLHFRAFYNLVTQAGEEIDCHAPRPAPRLWLEDAPAGVSGASVFCPDTQLTTGTD